MNKKNIIIIVIIVCFCLAINTFNIKYKYNELLKDNSVNEILIELLEEKVEELETIRQIKIRFLKGCVPANSLQACNCMFEKLYEELGYDDFYKLIEESGRGKEIPARALMLIMKCNK